MTSAPTGSAAGHGPYGPRTKQVRDFLVRFAGLGQSAASEVVARYAAVSNTPAFALAESVVGETIAKAGLVDARDALAGPLLQLVRGPQNATSADGEDVPLLPVGEPALGALLALMTEGLVDADVTNLLYSPFDLAIPR